MRGGLIPVFTVLLLESALVSAQETTQAPPQAPAAGAATTPAAPALRPVPADALSPYQPATPPLNDAPVAADCFQGPPAAWWKVRAEEENRFRISAEYLLWTARGNVPQDLRNVLSGGGINADSVLGTLPLTQWRNGVRVFASFTPANDWPTLEVGGFYLEQAVGSFNASVSTHPGNNPSQVPPALILQPVVGGVIDVANSRGVVDTPIPGPDGQVDLDPSDVLNSHLQGFSRGQLWGTEVNLKCCPYFFGALRYNFLVGFRNLNLREKLTVSGDFSAVEPGAGGDPDESPNNPEDGHTNTEHTFDALEVRNTYYGAQVGISFDTPICDRVVLSGFAKFGVGGNREKVASFGSTLLDATTIETNAGGPFVPRPTTNLPGGLFTPQVPGGTVIRSTRLSVMPDFNINVGYLITPHLEAYLGYNYLYMSNVVRLANQSISNQTSNQGHLNLHGADFGLQFSY